MRKHRLELLVGERLADAGGDGHRRVVGAKSGGEGVELRGRDLKDVRRRLEPGALGHVVGQLGQPLVGGDAAHALGDALAATKESVLDKHQDRWRHHGRGRGDGHRHAEDGRARVAGHRDGLCSACSHRGESAIR